MYVHRHSGLDPQTLQLAETLEISFGSCTAWVVLSPSLAKWLKWFCEAGGGLA